MAKTEFEDDVGLPDTLGDLDKDMEEDDGLEEPAAKPVVNGSNPKYMPQKAKPKEKSKETKADKEEPKTAEEPEPAQDLGQIISQIITEINELKYRQALVESTLYRQQAVR